MESFSVQHNFWFIIYYIYGYFIAIFLVSSYNVSQSVLGSDRELFSRCDDYITNQIKPSQQCQPVKPSTHNAPAFVVLSLSLTTQHFSPLRSFSLPIERAPPLHTAAAARRVPPHSEHGNLCCVVWKRARSRCRRGNEATRETERERRSTLALKSMCLSVQHFYGGPVLGGFEHIRFGMLFFSWTDPGKQCQIQGMCVRNPRSFIIMFIFWRNNRWQCSNKAVWYSRRSKRFESKVDNVKYFEFSDIIYLQILPGWTYHSRVFEQWKICKSMTI